MTEKEAGERSGRIVVLPLGATEQHGPHLPLETDALIAAGVVERTRRVLPAGLDVSFLPVEPVGYSPEHLFHPGTRSLSYADAVERWIGIGAEQAAQGVRRLVLLNAHGGNAPLMTIVATELRLRFSMLAVATSWTRFALPDGLVSSDEKALGIHGGQIETAVMLALHPDRVDMAKARNFPSAQSDFSGRFTHLRAYGPHAFGWLMPDLSHEGVVGDASGATPELGNRILQTAASGFAQLLQDVAAFDLAHFDQKI